jgi:hypothetical protein
MKIVSSSAGVALQMTAIGHRLESNWLMTFEFEDRCIDGDVEAL